MKKSRFVLTFLGILLLPFLLQAQVNFPKKEINAIQNILSIKIDGIMNEAIWQESEIATDFIISNPTPNVPCENNTEVRILYDNASVYIGATMYEVSMDSILRQLCLRDEGDQNLRGPFGNTNTDWFGVIFDSYKSGVDAFGFAVSAAGVQFDLKISENGSDDKNWDAVWKSNITLHDDKWVLEMKIPFSALRFPNVDEQEWFMNFTRLIRRKREESWWNPVDPAIEGTLNQMGILKGISNIKPPIRLQATPYIAAVIENTKDGSSSTTNQNLSGGLDIKYGLNDAFTLDMTLIPNFGDVAQDNQVLNLSAFEVRFDENRPFFTEGTELFNKGGLFYSRRIGGRPIYASDTEDRLNDNEIVDSNPIETPLYNALKLSGRTNNGLGIGVINAVTQSTFATLKDTITGLKRKFETNPITNYNVLVFDQNLKNNSFISFTNANTTRFGDAYDANSTAIVFGVNNKKRTLNVSGSAKLSQKYEKDANDELNTSLGHAYSLSVEKTGGKLGYGMSYNVESDTYDPNDLGFLFNNNERSTGIYLNYREFEPFGKFNSMSINASINYSMLYEPDLYVGYTISASNNYTLKTFFSMGYRIEVSPSLSKDYFEARQDDNFQTYVEIPPYVAASPWISSDYRKKFAYDVRLRFVYTPEEKRYDLGWTVSPRFRFSDKLFMVWNTQHDYESNNVGFVDYDDSDESVLGVRDLNTVTNSLSANYIFNNQMGITLRGRHYWSKVTYDSYHYINDKGRLISDSDTGFDNNGNVSYNAFTIDLIYRWRFAPGSDLVFVWKNFISNDQSLESPEDLTLNYFQNFGSFGDFPQTNSFNLKIIYFLDYYTLKNKWAKRKNS
ncbi:MAG: hypothetical protein ACI94Y_000013 [Maribacter sp.]|jgi:hypothetical protein